jgi:hypothetical protein
MTLSTAAISPDMAANRSPHVHEFIDMPKESIQEKKSWEQQRRRPALLFRRSHATVRCKRCASLKMLGILAILQK